MIDIRSRSSATSGWRKLAGAVALAAGLGLVAAPALAAGTSTHTTSWDFQTSGDLTNGKTYWLDVAWEADDQTNAQPPIVYTFTFPTGIEGVSKTFDIWNPAHTEKTGQCIVDTAKVECTLEDAYVTTHPEQVKGAFNMQGKIVLEDDDLQSTPDIKFEVDGKTITRTVRPKPSPSGPSGPTENCSGDACNWNGFSAYKSGSYRQSETTLHGVEVVPGDINWYIYVPTAVDGHANTDGTIPTDTKITVTDYLQPGQSYKAGPFIKAFFCIRHDKTGKEVVAGERDVTADVSPQYSSDKLSVTFKAIAPPADACTGVSNSTGAPANTPAPRALAGGAYRVFWIFHNDQHEFGGKQTPTNVADIKVGEKIYKEQKRILNVNMAGGVAGGLTEFVPTVPTVRKATCDRDTIGQTVWEKVDLPPNLANVIEYTSAEDTDTHIVTVTARLLDDQSTFRTNTDGDVIDDDDQSTGFVVDSTNPLEATWRYTLQSLECVPTAVDLVAPTVTQATCGTDGKDVWDTLTLPTTTGVAYTQALKTDTADTKTVLVTATIASDGYILKDTDGWTVAEGGKVATQEVTLNKTVCTVPTTPVDLVAPTVTQAICGKDDKEVWDTLALPTTTGVAYTQAQTETDDTRTVTVTATAAAGYTLKDTADWTVAEGGKTATTTVELKKRECEIAPIPTLSQWGLVLLGMLMAGGLMLRRRHQG